MSGKCPIHSAVVLGLSVVVSVGMLFVPSDSEACSAAALYNVEIVGTDLPACAKIRSTGVQSTRNFEVENDGCPNPIRFDQIDCEMCFPSFEIDDNEIRKVRVEGEDLQEGESTQTLYRWRIGQNQGTLEAKTTYRGPGDACEGWGVDTGPGLPRDDAVSGDTNTGETAEDVGSDLNPGDPNAAPCSCSRTGGHPPGSLAFFLLVSSVVAFRRWRR